jgi:hypothetical protein
LGIENKYICLLILEVQLTRSARLLQLANVGQKENGKSTSKNFSYALLIVGTADLKSN